MVQQGLQMSEIVKKFQTIKMVFHAGNFFHRDVSFSVSAAHSLLPCWGVGQM
jgi:hypothetical protein